MPKKPKSEEVAGKDTWSEDQKEREYYYDDAHGYEAYDPEEEGDDDGSVNPNPEDESDSSR